MKTVMVTGASGMIGLALTETLLEKGFKVIGTDSKPNDFVNSPNYSFVQASIDDKSSITNILNGSSIDALVHLACSCDNDFPPIITSAEEKLSSAVDKYLYKAAVDAGVGDIILLSTYQVYAPQKTREPIRETSDEKPTTAYGKMKYESERAMAKVVTKSPSCKCVIARVSPIYTKTFTDNLKAKVFDPKEGCAFVYGYGDYGYSFCCVYNLVDFIVGILNIAPGVNYMGVYNVCDTKPIAAKDILDVLRECHAIGAVVQRNLGSEGIKGLFNFGGGGKNDYRYNDISLACSNISYDNTKAQRISAFRWKLSNTK